MSAMTSIGVRMLVANYPPLGGGSERQCALLARSLTRLGDRVAVITRRMQKGHNGVYNAVAELPTPGRAEPANGIDVHRVGAPLRGRGARALSYSIAALVDLLRDRRDYDIVHCHGFEALALLGVAARTLAGKRLVVKVVTSGSFGDAMRLAAFPAGGWIARTLARADAVIVLNEEARSEMMRLGVPAEKIASIPNGVEIPPEVSAERGGNFAFCGRLVAQKNVAGLLRAWARTRAARSRRLEIVGDGPLLGELERLARELGVESSVLFPGRVDDARAIVARAAGVVLFSHAEGLSNLLLESMAAATPVIASDVAGNADLVRGEENGLLVPPGDEENLALAIDRLAEDRGLAARLGAAGRERMIAQYGIAHVAERVHDLYERIL